MRRVALTIPMLFIISLLSFALLYYSPGDSASIILRKKASSSVLTKEDIEEFSESKGLNKGFMSLFGKWISGIIRGDLGKSYLNDENINLKLFKYFNITIFMSTVGIFVYLFFGIIVGMYLGTKPKGIIDKIVRYWAVLASSVPVFWIALFIVWFFSVKMKMLTTIGSRNISSLFLPGFITGIIPAGNLIMIIKEKTKLVLREPFIISARAMGLRTWTIMSRHVLKNIMAPVISMIALTFPYFIGFSLIMEQVFSIKGFGFYLGNAINLKDYMIVASGIMVIGILVSFVNLIADIIYILIDRRDIYEK
ncbi:MAG: ABC transporter permease [Tissierellia bacterium]|nr:ABC transporter permease [Tissierellia bacterium]